MAQKRTYQTVESGPKDPRGSLHPISLKNYGKWKYHERPRPGVLKHVAISGDILYTVRAGTHRQVTVDIVRRLCDLADKYSDGFLRWTMRNNVEFSTPTESNVTPLIQELESLGHPVGGTGNSVGAIAHTQGWLHCDIPATDASGVVKSMMDELYDEFVKEEMPNRVRLSTVVKSTAAVKPTLPWWFSTPARPASTTTFSRMFARCPAPWPAVPWPPFVRPRLTASRLLW